MDHPIRVTVFLPRAPLFYCIDKRSEIAWRDFPGHDDHAFSALHAVESRGGSRMLAFLDLDLALFGSCLRPFGKHDFQYALIETGFDLVFVDRVRNAKGALETAVTTR